MVFSSISFLFFFLPAFLVVFYLLKPKFRFVFLFFSSLFFYFWGENLLVWILLASTSIDYIAALIISDGFGKKEIKSLEKGAQRSKRQKLGLTISIISNLCFLGYFKYANFFIGNVYTFCQSIGLDNFISEQTIGIALPLGISFYTFQSMSYTIDVYRGSTTATRNYIEFAAYVTMFPQLVAGPIIRYRDIEPQIMNHKVSLDDFIIGIKRFIIGLAKKVIIANTLASVADTVFALPKSELSTGLAWIGVITYSLQIYYDFSGYSSMAIGLGRMIGFRYLENFNFPFISRSIHEFWQRWHISLSTWFRDYLYFPLGGSKKGKFLTYRNLFLVFIICGLWHGASWNFIIWGLYWGVFLVLERFNYFKQFTKIPRIFQHLYVLLVINFSWAFFRTDSLKSGFHFFFVLLGINSAEIQLHSIRALLRPNVTLAIILGVMFSMPIVSFVRTKIATLISKNSTTLDVIYLCVLITLFVFSTMLLASGTYNPFIYFRF